MTQLLRRHPPHQQYIFLHSTSPKQQKPTQNICFYKVFVIKNITILKKYVYQALLKELNLHIYKVNGDEQQSKKEKRFINGTVCLCLKMEIETSTSCLDVNLISSIDSSQSSGTDAKAPTFQTHSHFHAFEIRKTGLLRRPTELHGFRSEDFLQKSSAEIELQGISLIKRQNR